MGFGGLELRARCAGFSVTEIGNRKERMRVREAGASAAGRGQCPYASFPDQCPQTSPPLPHLNHVFLQPHQNALFQPRNVALADAHHVRDLLLRLLLTAAQPKAQPHDLLFPHG